MDDPKEPGVGEVTPVDPTPEPTAPELRDEVWTGPPKGWFADARSVEKSVWWFLALVVGVITWDGRYPIPALGSSRTVSSFVNAGLVLLFPTLHWLVFGALPFEQKRKQHRERTRRPSPPGSTPSPAPPTPPVPTTTGNKAESSNPPTPGAFQQLANSSAELSTSIYRRAGTFLFVGTLIALSGMVFFYYTTAAARLTDQHEPVIGTPDKEVPSKATPEKSDGETTKTAQPTTGTAVLAQGQTKADGKSEDTEPPKASLLLNLYTVIRPISVLFFIELVAFFFLRQYRLSMDEFRYYEAIQRQREETAALLALLQDAASQPPVRELLREKCFFSPAPRLASNETTEILEARKLHRDELDVLARVVEAIKHPDSGKKGD